MGQSVFPAASAASKTRYVETLTSGTSWTVPAGVTYVNATLVGGGGGGGTSIRAFSGQVITTNVATTPGNTVAYAIGAGGYFTTKGGSTTFTGATTAIGGDPGQNGNFYDTGYAANPGIGAENGGRAGAIGGGGQGSYGGDGQIVLEYWK
jgi:hypothetical protein